MILPDWLAVKVLPMILFVLIILWVLRNNRREIERLKDEWKSKQENHG